MKTYILSVDESQESALKTLAKALRIDLKLINEADEDKAPSMAMEEGKKYGRLSEMETLSKRSKAKKQVQKNTAKERFLHELKESVKEVALAKKGKIKLQTAKDFLHEL